MREPVGTELSSLIPDWAVANSKGCGCRNYAKKMDRWGLSGCEANRKAIVKHLTQQSDNLIPLFRNVPEALKRAIATRLLNKAMRNAKKKTEQ